jgi:hypothetical protein
MAATDIFTNPPKVGGYEFPSSTSFNYDVFRPDLGNVLDLNSLGLGGASAPSPVQPGAEPGWGKQLEDFLGGVGKFGAGLGAGIAAARGDMPMAGQLLSNYFQDKTGDTDESGESSLEKALRALKESGLISFKLNTDDESDNLRI